MTKLTVEQVKYNLSKVPGWRLAEGDMALYRTFTYGDLASAIRLVNQAAEYMVNGDYYPDIRITGTNVTFTLSSRQVQGLTGKDFALAQVISKLA